MLIETIGVGSKLNYEFVFVRVNLRLKFLIYAHPRKSAENQTSITRYGHGGFCDIRSDSATLCTGTPPMVLPSGLP
jgi:hypothetical protein